MNSFRHLYQFIALLSGILLGGHAAGFAQAWSTSGNSLSGSENLGSLNNRPLRVITQGIERFRVQPSGDIQLNPETAIRNGAAGLQFSSFGTNKVIQLSSDLNSPTNGQQLLIVPAPEATTVAPSAPDGLIQLVDGNASGSLKLATGFNSTSPRGVYINGNFSTGGNRSMIHLMNGTGDQLLLDGEVNHSRWFLPLGLEMDGLVNYTNDLHSSYTNRSLVDKEYVDDQIAGIVGDSDWLISGDDLIAGPTGLVGIGTASPQAKMELDLPADLGDNAGLQISAPFAFLASGSIAPPKHYFRIRRMNSSGSGFATRFTVRVGGNVGIGLDNPEVKTHISGNAQSDSDLLLFSTKSYNGSELGFSRHGVDNHRGYWAYNARLVNENWEVDVSSNNGAATRILQGGGVFFQYYKTQFVQGPQHNWQPMPKGNWINAIHIDHNNGKVGMGTSNFVGNFRLYVKDGILTERVKVELQGNWPDFVFAEEHPLSELDSVEQYINENHHLPGIPSAETVAEEGIDLGNMDAALLQKIEELTLYVIQLKKDNEALKSEMESLQNK